MATIKYSALKILEQIPDWIKSKYLLTFIGFVGWMFFFDDRDIITTHFKHPHELQQLEESKEYFEKQIADTRKELDQLKKDPTTLEKYAREKYFMKRDNEDLFVVKEK